MTVLKFFTDDLTKVFVVHLFGIDLYLFQIIFKCGFRQISETVCVSVLFCIQISFFLQFLVLLIACENEPEYASFDSRIAETCNTHIIIRHGSDSGDPQFYTSGCNEVTGVYVVGRCISFFYYGFTEFFRLTTLIQLYQVNFFSVFEHSQR